MSRYAISDIHGNVKTFEALLDKIGLSTADELYLLGDYVDRGPDTRGVFDQIFILRKLGYKVHCLVGNHEEMMLNANDGDKEDFDFWFRNGGKETLASFESNRIELVPDQYWEFIQSLSTHFLVDNYIMVHAGLNFKAINPLADSVNMRWARRWYDSIDYSWLGERIILHGHTKTAQSTIEQMVENLDQNRYLDIDNGCYSQAIGQGQLCAFNLDTRELVFQKNVENSFM